MTITPTQADRDAAAYYGRYRLFSGLSADSIVEGRADLNDLVQAFALHAQRAREQALAAKDAEIARLRAIIASQIQWTPGEPPKEDGAVVYGVTWQPYRWKAYSPKSEQFRRGIKGRWQAMGEYGGWNNAPAPNEWATEEAVIARAALNGEAENG